MIGNSFQQYLESIHAECAGIDGGALASYIPELTRADPNWFGIALITVDGHVYQVGDSRQPFTIQSISKAITYGIALEDQGVDAVLRKVDVEPSGEAFNSISLEPGTGRPRNPMINAGAIATVGLVAGDTPEEKFSRMLKCYARYLGHDVQLDDDVYRSEKSTGHRNRAIAYLLHNSNIIERDTDEILDVYFRQCSLLVTCRDLALIGATLANNGVNPITGVRALQEKYVSKTLSVMSSCGMYDYSGAWVYEVGMPAKSGVGGGIVAVLPGQFGLAVFSPKLDDRGNSTRGIAVCKRISRDYTLHPFHTGTITASATIRARYNAAQLPSKRTRNPLQTQALSTLGTSVSVLELQGSLTFASAEIVIRETMNAADSAAFLILDFARVGVIDGGAINLLVDLVNALDAAGKTMLLTGLPGNYALVRALGRRMTSIEQSPLLRFSELDRAIEWCEDQLLAARIEDCEGESPLREQVLCTGLDAEELAFLETLLVRQAYAQGAPLCREGDPADSLFFITAGEVSVCVPLSMHRSGRISTFSAGSALGEMAMLDGGRRSADIIADTDVRCLILHYADLEQHQDPRALSVKLKLVSNIARVLTRKLRQATNEIRLLRH